MTTIQIINEVEKISRELSKHCVICFEEISDITSNLCADCRREYEDK